MMFPHAVTVYNIDREIDPETMEEIKRSRATILRGVLLEITAGATATETGTEDANTVTLYVPFDVDAVDANSGKHRRFISADQWRNSRNHAQVWTLDSLDNNCYFVKGESYSPLADLGELSAENGIYAVTAVRTMDFGELQHWEVSGA